jgi:site-specific DNA-methyltransferase (adenine-specific)
MSEGKKEILLGYCLELMKYIPNGSIDMILCDLPYGTTACKWDTIIPFDKLWEQYERIIKPNGAIVLTASQPFTSALVMSNPKLFRYEWIWIKNRGSNFALANKMPIKEHESCLVFYKKLPTYNAIKQQRAESGKERVKTIINPSTVSENYGGIVLQEGKIYEELRFPSSWQKFNCEVGLHPTQKPISLFEYLVKTYTNENDLVLDNCAGSGTTAIACLNTNRQFIVMEKEQKYYDIILKRVGDFNKNFVPKTLFENEM